MPRSTNPVLNRSVVWLLAIGLAYGAFKQGAFYAEDFKVLAALAMAAALVALLGIRASPKRSDLAVFGGLFGLAALAGASALHHGDARSSLPIVATCVATAGVVYACGVISPSSRRLLAHLLMLVGLIIAITSWAGVAFHRYPWALPSQTLWRGASTLTYANAAAAALFAPMVIAAVAYVRTRHLGYLVVSYVLAVGWAATLSRAAATSLVIAVLVVLVRSQRRREVLCLWPLVPATVVAMVALLPSLPEHDAARPGIAAAGVLIGLIALIAAARIRPRYALSAVVAVTAAVIVAVGATGQASTALNRISSTRVGVQSSDRTDLLNVAWSQFKDNPIAGVGPGQINFAYVNHAGEPVLARYTHNEYLQLAAEIGFGAFVLLGVVFVGFLIGMRERSIEHIGAVVALLAFASHSALEFLWHVPEVTLLVVASVCVLRDGVTFDHVEDSSNISVARQR